MAAAASQRAARLLRFSRWKDVADSDGTWNSVASPSSPRWSVSTTTSRSVSGGSSNPSSGKPRSDGRESAVAQVATHAQKLATAWPFRR